MTAPARACSECMFFEPREGEMGECRRRAPTPKTRAGVGAWWPSVYNTDWCGDFRRKHYGGCGNSLCVGQCKP